MTDELDLTLREAVLRFGASAQMAVAIEELSELQRALARVYAGRMDRENIVEEIADVGIMLVQMQAVFGITEAEIADVQAIKIARLRRRLNEYGRTA